MAAAASASPPVESTRSSTARTDGSFSARCRAERTSEGVTMPSAARFGLAESRAIVPATVTIATVGVAVGVLQDASGELGDADVELRQRQEALAGSALDAVARERESVRAQACVVACDTAGAKDAYRRALEVSRIVAGRDTPATRQLEALWPVDFPQSTFVTLRLRAY